MTSRQHLKELEAQRKQSWRAATYEFARLKRDVRHAVSPARMARKHPEAAVGVAALLGWLIAPAGSRAAEVITPPSSPQAAPAPRRASLVSHLVSGVYKRFLSRVDWMGLAASVLARNSAPDGARPDGQEQESQGAAMGGQTNGHGADPDAPQTPRWTDKSDGPVD